ncbi:MAG: hypothetical protein WC501_02095 [Candidatus Micrarchaeia archaeon]
MEVVFECDSSKKKDLLKILESGSLDADSFARVGYILKDGPSIGEGHGKVYLYIKSNEEFIKKALERLKDVALKSNEEVSKKIIEKIRAEEEQATSGFGDIFG